MSAKATPTGAMPNITMSEQREKYRQIPEVPEKVPECEQQNFTDSSESSSGSLETKVLLMLAVSC